MGTPRVLLGQELRSLRQFAGLTTRQLADRVESLSQPMISRIENGAKTPTRPQIQAWVKATGADRETRDRLIRQAEAIYTEVRAWRHVLVDENRHLQDEVLAREKSALAVCNYQPAIIPGLLQTRDYAEALIPLIDLANRVDHAAAVEGRMERQRTLLEPGHAFRFLIGESALHWNPGISETQFADQMSRVAILAALDTVDVAVLPSPRTGVAVSLGSFVIFDGEDEHVTVELPHGSVRVSDVEDVALYRQLYELLWGVAVQGQEVIALFQGLAAESRARG